MKKGKAKNNRLLPNSLKIISSCLKNVSTNATTAVRSAGASVAASISSSSDHLRDQVTWAGFDKFELAPTSFKHVLLLGYQNGFQVFDVEDATNFSELVSKRAGAVTFLQMLPIPVKSGDQERFRMSHPLLLVVTGDESTSRSLHKNGCKDNSGAEPQLRKEVNSQTAVQFYSLRSNSFVQVIKFRSAVYMVRCSPRIVAVGLATQIYCIDALTLENKFSVLTYPVPQFGEQGVGGVNIGYGPMAVGPRWLAYASDNPLSSSKARLSPKKVTPSGGASPSTSPNNGSFMARCAMESSKQLAAGMVSLGDIGYKTLSRFADGTSTLAPSSSGWKAGRPVSSESENAGMVLVMDFVSRAVISQFRAHTSPISALCFDPSGTLVVTASIHGNSINIFRIIPSSKHDGSGNKTHDWSSAHVHLYKLYRGFTTAIIQDICFSNCSQWVAVISNKGTCHIYVISPFGGDVGFTLSDPGEFPSVYPMLLFPWWSPSCFAINQHSSQPPPLVTHSVVSRIRDSNSGLLSSVTGTTISAPSGAIAAAFHDSVCHGTQHTQPRPSRPLQHLLVFTPSGHVVQYKLVPLVGIETCGLESGLRTRSGASSHSESEELRVKAEPFQWWDVCRRSDWAEREEPVHVSNLAGDCQPRTVLLETDCNVGDGQKQVVRNDSLKLHDKSHRYLSNMEVKINSGRLPIWQNPKIHVYVMTPPSGNSILAGELAIEQIQSHEVEMKRKDLLPVFDNFHGLKPSWTGRMLSGGAYPSVASVGPYPVGERVSEQTQTVICHSKPASLSSNESSDGGSSRRIENFLDLDQMNSDFAGMPIQEFRGRVNSDISMLNQKTLAVTSLADHLKNAGLFTDDYDNNGLCAVQSKVPSSGPDGGEEHDSPSASPQSPMNPGHLFQAKKVEPDGVGGVNEVVKKEIGCSENNGDRHNPEEDEDNDELLGTAFSLFEEG